MILSCPNCATRFRIDADKLGVAGRKVRCAKCGHGWHATPDQDEEAQSADEAPAETAPAAEEDAAESGGFGESADDDSDGLPEGPPPFESFEAMRARMGDDDAPRRRRPRAQREAEPKPSRLKGVLAWLVFLAVVGGLVAGGWVARFSIVDTFPTAAKLYDLVGVPINTVAPGLQIQNVQPSRRLKDGESFLVIEGRIVNKTSGTQPVPALRVTLKDETGAIIDSWRIAANSAAIAPGGETVFSTQKVSPPKNAREISIVFIQPGT